jgi:hypothetical protein
MVMSSQQRADVLLAHWRNLWPLAPAERMKRIDEIERDYEYEHLLDEVASAMQEPEADLQPSTFIQACVVTLFIGCCLGLCIIAVIPVPV